MSLESDILIPWNRTESRKCLQKALNHLSKARCLGLPRSSREKVVRLQDSLKTAAINVVECIPRTLRDSVHTKYRALLGAFTAFLGAKSQRKLRCFGEKMIMTYSDCALSSSQLETTGAKSHANSGYSTAKTRSSILWRIEVW